MKYLHCFFIFICVWELAFSQNTQPKHYYIYQHNLKKQKYELSLENNVVIANSFTTIKGREYLLRNDYEYRHLLYKKWKRTAAISEYNHWASICKEVICSVILVKDYVYYHRQSTQPKNTTKDSVCFFTPRSPLHGGLTPLFIYDKTDSLLSLPIVYYTKTSCNVIDSVRISYFGGEPYHNNKNYKVYTYQLDGFFLFSESKKEYRKMAKVYFCPQIGIVGYEAYNERGRRFRKSKLIEIDGVNIKEILAKQSCFTGFCE